MKNTLRRKCLYFRRIKRLCTHTLCKCSPFGGASTCRRCTAFDAIRDGSTLVTGLGQLLCNSIFLRRWPSPPFLTLSHFFLLATEDTLYYSMHYAHKNNKNHIAIMNDVFVFEQCFCISFLSAPKILWRSGCIQV